MQGTSSAQSQSGSCSTAAVDNGCSFKVVVPSFSEDKLLNRFAIFVAGPTLSTPSTTTMKCAFINCVNPEVIQTDPCSVCDREVHHLCSNDLYDPGNISVRDACVAAWKAKNPPLGVNPSANNQLNTFDVVGWSPDTPHQLASQASSTESESAEVILPPGSQVCGDSYGIPLDIHHYRQISKRDNVWDVVDSRCRRPVSG
ncbi:hypothetical protein PC129_g185 [Phytophthora cactorum]|uniref:Uncharacterized protein n=2 Tax=Phytophthora cactorum TaxID=29920 RepID=A0A8T1J2C1_9STRA|nr:hypothetical protein PC114_g1030 [Phytophthora cactorum]KAG3229302.1 hypothetical protein PC129_g185 [Phytophthora cactorum]KAG4250668.1 hypothetical protein PC116_g1607 [Phytophthora cactorum]